MKKILVPVSKHFLLRFGLIHFILIVNFYSRPIWAKMVKPSRNRRPPARLETAKPEKPEKEPRPEPEKESVRWSLWPLDQYILQTWYILHSLKERKL